MLLSNLKKLWLKYNRVIKLSFQLTVTLVLLGLVFSRVKPEQIIAVFSRLNIELWLLGLGTSVLLVVIPAYRFGLLAARSYGRYEKLGFWISLQFRAWLYNNLLPGTIGGDLSRALDLSSQNLDIKKGAILVLLDRLIGLAATVLLFCGAIMLTSQKVPGFPRFNAYNLSIIIASLCLALLLVYKSARIKAAIKKIYPGNLRLSSIGLILLLALIYQGADIFIAFIYGRALGIELALKNYFFFFPLVYIATVLPISLNGLGVREITITGLMAVAGIAPSLSLSLALLIFLDRIVKGVLGLVSVYKR